MKLFLFLLILSGYFVFDVYSFNNETRLLKDIKENRDYNRNIRKPTEYESKPIEVDIKTELKTIRSLDMKEQILKISLGMTISWTDYFLTWDSSSYGNISKISLPLSQIWMPDVHLQNSAEKSYIFEDDEKRVTVYNNGLVEWQENLDLKTYCFVDTTKYPFEREICKLHFSAQVLDIKEQVLSIRMNDDFLNQFQSNGEWHISKPYDIRNYTTQTLNGKQISGVVLEIKMDRRQTYYVWKFLTPSIAITFINIATFCLPVKSGAKVTLSTFVVVSFAVMIQLFNESLPTSSDHISYFGRLLWLLLGISGLNLILNVIITAIFYRKCAICELFFCGTCDKYKENFSTSCCEKEEDGDASQDEKDESGNKITKDKNLGKEEIERNRKKKAAQFDTISFFVMLILYGFAYTYCCVNIFVGRENVA